MHKILPNAYIRKIPDMKQTGLSTGLGLPDYIIITLEETFWIEVKFSPAKKCFNMNLLSDSQWTEFLCMHNAGARILIAIYLNKELFIVPFDKLSYAKFVCGDKSIDKITLIKWRIKW